MPETITQRQLRNDNAEIMRRVEAGESFVVTRNGHPVADLVSHTAPAEQPERRLTAGALQEKRRKHGPHLSVEQWLTDRAADDLIFGDDRIEC